MIQRKRERESERIGERKGKRESLFLPFDFLEKQIFRLLEPMELKSVLIIEFLFFYKLIGGKHNRRKIKNKVFFCCGFLKRNFASPNVYNKDPK